MKWLPALLGARSSMDRSALKGLLAPGRPRVRSSIATLLLVGSVVAAGCTGAGSASPSSAPPPGTPRPVPTPTTAATSMPSASPIAADRAGWSVRDLVEPGALVDVVAGGPGVVSVGYRSWEEPTVATAWTSVDGVTWSRVPAPGGFVRGRMNAVALGPAGFVGVGRPGGEGYVTGASIWVSRDGLAWSVVEDPPGVGNRDLTSVIAWADRYYAGGNINGGWAGVLTSVDGLGWEVAWAAPVPAEAKGLLAGSEVTALGAFSGGIVAAVDERPGTSIRLSADGATWRTLGPPESDAFVRAFAAWGDGLLAVGRDARSRGAIWLSDDELEWRRVADLGEGEATDVAVSGGRALVASYSVDGTPALLTSTDGESWVPDPLPTEVAPWTLPLSVTAFGDGFVGVGSTGGAAIGSTRLAVWSQAGGR